ncbi:MAG: SH3 domain-containing protein [Christensenellales bacterium]|jgi:uncharacterized protein YjdB
MRLVRNDLPEASDEAYAGFALVNVTSSNPKVVLEQSGGEWTIKAANGASLTNQAVTFTFTFSNGGPNGTEELTFSAAAAVNITAKSGDEPAPNPAHAVSVHAPKATLNAGETVQLSVPGERIANAVSGNLSVAFATGDGRVIAIAPGTATIFVTTVEGGSGTIQISVLDANAQVFAQSTTLEMGETMRIFFANGEAVVSAHSGNARVVTVSNDGNVTAVSAGTATVYATGANGSAGTIAFIVTPKGLKISGAGRITVGETARLTLSEGETIASVTSSNPSTVSVTNDGTYKGVKNGTAVLTVTTVSGKTGTFAVTVTEKGSESARTLLVDQALQLKVMGKKILSASLEEGNGAIAVTDTGRVSALAEGEDTVILVTEDKQVHRVRISVSERTGKVTLTSGRLRLRTTPGTGSILVHLNNGAAVTILERAGIYYRVQATVNGKTYTGFVPRSYVKK